MSNAVSISLFNFCLIYLLLIIVAILMKVSKIDKTKLLLIASVRMTVQLVIAGYILMYLLENPSPILIISYVLIMCGFAIHRVLSVNRGLNKKFQTIIGISISFSALMVILFFIIVITEQSFFNPQYTIPISGMILGNAMTGVSLGVKTFISKYKDASLQMEVLLNQGATPKRILLPLVNDAFATALLPTINSMLGMGIVSLPGMMTGQILSGESPLTAILYQIAIMISISTVVCLSVYLSLQLGYKTLYNKDSQFLLEGDNQ